MSAILSNPATSSFPGRVQFLLSGMSTQVQVPDIASVYADAAEVPSCKSRSGGLSDAVLLKDARTGEIIADPIPDALEFNMRLPNLFKYVFFLHTDDVPEDLLEPAVWALEMFIRVLVECTEAQLRSVGHVTRTTPKQNVPKAREIMRLNAKYKVAIYMIKSNINRPADAAKYMEEIVSSLRTTAGDKQDVLLTYAEALSLSGTDDKQAQKILEKLLENIDTGGTGLAVLVKSKIFFARVLRRQGKDAAEKHEEWLVKWFRKNPHLFPEVQLRRLLLPRGPRDSMDRVLEVLGGPAWLDSREHTDKTDHRMVKHCRQCGAREPMVRLSVCKRCKKTIIECQKKNWPYHKNGCQDTADIAQRITQLSLLGAPSAAQREKDFHAWLDAVDHTPYLSALGVQRRPARGRTHMLFEEVMYTPSSTPQMARGKFRVVRCGVFRMADAYREIEKRLRLNPGEGHDYCEDVLKDMNSTMLGSARVTFLVLTYGDGVNPWLGGDGIAMHGLHVRPYDPEWRKAMNKDAPPAPMTLRCPHVEDAEFDYMSADGEQEGAEASQVIVIGKRDKLECQSI